MVVLICGTRGHTSDGVYFAVKETLEQIIESMWWYDMEIIHGACPDSPDLFGDRLGEEYGMEVRRFLADWKTHGKGAGFKRNKEMVKEMPDVTIAVWDGFSKGTEDTIVRSVQAGIPVRIVPVNELPEHTKKRQRS